MSIIYPDERRRIILAGKKIPHEYQEVEYIQATGSSNQFIDIKYYPTIKSRIEYKFKVTNPTPTRFLFNGEFYHPSTRVTYAVGIYLGGSGSDRSSVYEWNNCTGGLRYFFTEEGLWYDTNIHTVIQDLQNAFIKMDGNIIDQSEGISNIPDGCVKYPMTLFDGHYRLYYEVRASCYARFYYFRCYEDDKLFHEFIPCYRKSDNKACMYDTVNLVPYFNSGNGPDFIVGPNVY